MMFETAEFVGTIAFAMSGFFVATKYRLDLLGTLVSVFLTAFGGGIIRDAIADRVPYAFSNAMPGFAVIGVMVLMIVLRLHKKPDLENRPWFIVSDSVGLVSFSITGAMIALEVGFNLTGVLALAFLTAVGGGISRDVIINQVPFVFKTGFYGTVALLVGVVVYALSSMNLLNSMTLGVVFVIATLLRLTAYYKKWSVPLP